MAVDRLQKVLAHHDPLGALVVTWVWGPKMSP
jgi:hypothetical protein